MRRSVFRTGLLVLALGVLFTWLDCNHPDDSVDSGVTAVVYRYVRELPDGGTVEERHDGGAGTRSP